MTNHIPDDRGAETAGNAEYQPRTPERLIEILRAQNENPRSVDREAASTIERLLIRSAALPKQAAAEVMTVLAVAPEECTCGFCDGKLYLNRASYCCDKHTSVEFHIDDCEVTPTPKQADPSREELAQTLNDNRRARRGYSPQSIKYCKEAERNALLSDADALIASGFSLAAKPVNDGVREAFRNVDALDWQHLDHFIPQSGHGQFWRAVFVEVRAALSPPSPGERK